MLDPDAPSDGAIPKEFLDATVIEKQLRALAKLKSIFSPEVNQLRLRAASAFARVLTHHTVFALARDVVSTLWTDLLYKAIAEFRAKHKQLSTSKPPTSPRAILLLTAKFRSFLVNAQAFYVRLARDFARAHRHTAGSLVDLVVGGMVVEVGEEGDEEWEERTDEARRTEDTLDPAEIRDVVRRLLICLGDISRYRAQYTPLTPQTSAFSPASARDFYLLALAVDPSSGHAHNQLAVLAAYSGDELGAAEMYARSLLAAVPWSTARTNLDTTLKRARDRHDPSSVDRLTETFEADLWKRMVLSMVASLMGIGDSGVVVSATPDSTPLIPHIPALFMSNPTDIVHAFSLIVATPDLVSSTGHSVHAARESAVEWVTAVISYTASIGDESKSENAWTAALSATELALRWIIKQITSASPTIPMNSSHPMWTTTLDLLSSLATFRPAGHIPTSPPGVDHWAGYIVVDQADSQAQGELLTARSVNDAGVAEARLVWWGARLASVQGAPIFSRIDSAASRTMLSFFAVGEKPVDEGKEDEATILSQDHTENVHQDGMEVEEPALDSPQVNMPPSSTPSVSQAGVVDTVTDSTSSGPSRDIQVPIQSLGDLWAGNAPSVTALVAPTSASQLPPAPSPSVAPNVIAQSPDRTQPSKTHSLSANLPTSADIAGSLLRGLAGIGSGKTWGAGTGSGWENAPPSPARPEMPPRAASWTGGALVGSTGNPPVDPIEREMWERKRAEVVRDIYDPFGNGVGYAAQLVTAPPPKASPGSPFSRPTPPPGLGISSSATPLRSEGSFDRLGRDTMHLLGLEDEEPVVPAGHDLSGGGGISPVLPTGVNTIAWFPAMPLNEVGLTSQSSLPHPNPLSASTLPLSASLNEYMWPFGMPNQPLSNLLSSTTPSTPDNLAESGGPGPRDPIKEFTRKMQEAQRLH